MAVISTKFPFKYAQQNGLLKIIPWGWYLFCEFSTRAHPALWQKIAH